MTKLCSGQGNLDAAATDTAEAATNDTTDAATDAATADESNPYMSPFQATQKLEYPLFIKLNMLMFLAFQLYHFSVVHRSR